MERTGTLERRVSRVLCAAAVILFCAAAALNITGFLKKETQIVVPYYAPLTKRILLPLYEDAPEETSVAVNYHPMYKRFLIRMGEEMKTEWEPDEEDVVALAQTLWGECRGCSYIQKAAVCWCVFNRVDSKLFPGSIIEVVSQPNQFFGYSPSFPVDEELYEIAYNCIVDWHNGENRVLDPEFTYFHGNGRINIFTTQYGGDGGRRWSEE